MTRVKRKIVSIVGPTASGKSDTAIRLAKKFGGEIISADSRQVYRGLDIGSGKVSGTRNSEGVFVSEGIPHHLIDIADPMEDFNVSHFKQMASASVEDILGRGNVPIICGGTGFWISALIDSAEFPKVKPDPLLRSKLRSKSREELFEKLKKIDPKRAETIDKNNSVRLIRAIEIAMSLGSVPEIIKRKSKYDALQIGIDIPREILNGKIRKRLEERLKKGMIREIENLHENGTSWEWLEKIGLEYRWISRYLQGKIAMEEMGEKLYFDIIHYAKRQMTWFRKNENIAWFSSYEEIEKATKKFLT